METQKAFTKFKAEALIIGRLLAAYADLELSLFCCINVIRDDFNTVYKAMFKARGETQRIDMADIFGRESYHEIELGTQFEMAISSIRYCLKIRNQYAHCLWYDDLSKNLAFANLEEITEKNAPIKDLKDLTIRYVDVPTLSLQESYFEYTDNSLSWLNDEGLRSVGKLSTPQRPAPKQLKQPPLYMP